MKQILDKSEKLISEQSDEIYGVNTINWEDSSWKYLSLTGDEEKKSSVSCTQRFPFFQVLYFALERWTRTQNQIMHGKTGWRGSKVEQNTELWTKWWRANGIRVECLPTWQFVREVQEFLSKLSVEPENFTGRYLHVDVRRHLMGI